MAAAEAKGHKKGPKKEKKNVPHAVATVQASFNNTIVAITDPSGNVLAWSSAGRIGFKGSRKGTPFAAQLAAGNAAQLAQEHGVRTRLYAFAGLSFSADTQDQVAQTLVARVDQFMANLQNRTLFLSGTRWRRSAFRYLRPTSTAQ